MEQGAQLSGLKLLVVEDEPLVATALQNLLIDSGFTVIGPASSLEQGLRLTGEQVFDGAVLDLIFDNVFEAPAKAIICLYIRASTYLENIREALYKEVALSWS